MPTERDAAVAMKRAIATLETAMIWFRSRKQDAYAMDCGDAIAGLRAAVKGEPKLGGNSPAGEGARDRLTSDDRAYVEEVRRFGTTTPGCLVAIIDRLAPDPY